MEHVASGGERVGAHQRHVPLPSFFHSTPTPTPTPEEKKESVAAITNLECVQPLQSVGSHQVCSKLFYDSKHIQGSKERYLLGQNTTCKFPG